MPVYEFGPFTLDPAERRLTRDGRRVSVPAKAWQILLMLVEAGGRLVRHEEFRAKLWPNVVVEDRTLTVHMSTLRKALGSRDLIETVSRTGYRLAVPVSVPSQPPSAPPPVEAEGHWSCGRSRPVTSRRTTAISASASPMPSARRWARCVGSASRRSAPSRIRRRTRSRRLAELGAGHLLEGTVERNAERLQVTTRLIDVESGRTERSGRFEQSRADGAALQDEITAWVADSLPRSTAAELRSYRPRSAEAYFLQLQARAHLKPFTRLPLLKAHALFEQALALDPDYAMAHAGPRLDLPAAGVDRHAAAVAGRRGDAARPQGGRARDRPRRGARRGMGGAGPREDGIRLGLGRRRSRPEPRGRAQWQLGRGARHARPVPERDGPPRRGDRGHAAGRRLDPRHIETLQHLAIVYWMAGQSERALETTRREPEGRGHAARPLRPHDGARPSRPPRRGDGRAPDHLARAGGRPGPGRTRRARRPHRKLAVGDGGLDLPARAHQSLGRRGDAVDGGRAARSRARCAGALREGAHHLPVFRRADAELPAAAQQPALSRYPAGDELDGRTT